MSGPLITVLRRPGVARLAVAGALSEIGDWMLMIALPLYVLQLSGSPLLTAVVFALELMPTVLLGPLAGVLVDRWERRRLLVSVLVLQAAALLPLLAVESADEIGIVLAVVVVQSVLATIVEPGRSAAAVQLVPRGDLVALNGAFGTLSGLARLVGGPLGGLVLALGGADAVVFADAATFVVCAALLATGRRMPAPSRAGPSRLLADWAAGMAVIKASPVLRRVLGVTACMALAQGGFVVLFVLFAVRDLGAGDPEVGLLRGVQAIGAVAGGLLIAAFARVAQPHRLLVAALVAFGLITLVIWNAPLVTTKLGWYVALFIAVGVPGVVAVSVTVSLLQHEAGEAAAGRVLSAYTAVFGALQAGGMLIAGLFGTDAGLTVALQVQGVLHLVAAALALRIPAPAETRS